MPEEKDQFDLSKFWNVRLTDLPTGSFWTCD